MPDPTLAPRRKPDLYFLLAGAVSSLLFLSIFLSFAFLLPVQIAFGRKGARAGMAAAGVSAGTTAVVQAAHLALAGGGAPGEVGASWPLALAGSVVMPIAFLLALALINAPFARRWPSAYRVIGVTALCAALMAPLLASVERDPSITAYMEDEVGSLFKPLRSAAADSLDEGYEASALAAALDPKDMVATSFEVLRNSLAAFVFTALAGSWWIGNRLSGRDSPGRKGTAPLSELRLPYPFLWGFLLAWTGVLAASVLKASAFASAAAWNCALVTSIAYAAVGLGIVSHLLKTWNTPKGLKAILIVTAVVSLATPVGLAVVALLPLLGVTEIWIHYRKPKGVGA